MSPTRSIRARDIGIPMTGTPGRHNAITDVAGVEVGYTTLWSGAGKLQVGLGPVRTGVTAVLPRGCLNPAPWFAASFALNGAGEMTGLTWLEERGLGEGPVLITNTHSVGVVRDSAIKWMRRHGWAFQWTLPIVAETCDAPFNDMDGEHIKAEHVFSALDSAAAGPIAEGNVGGGTGMSTYGYKGGTGTASRKLAAAHGGYTIGVLVQSNYGERRLLRIAGIKMGDFLAADGPRFLDSSLLSEEFRKEHAYYFGGAADQVQTGDRTVDGSIIVIVATDAPLMPHQLKRLAKRPALAIGRLGGLGAVMSGDIFLALSTANPSIDEKSDAIGTPGSVLMHPNKALTPLFEAVVDATEEAILNAMIAAEAGEGANRFYVPRLPHERVREKLAQHGLLVESAL